MSSSLRKNSRALIYTLLAVLLVADALFNLSAKRRSDSDTDDYEISAARRLPHVATAEDALY